MRNKLINHAHRCAPAHKLIIHVSALALLRTFSTCIIVHIITINGAGLLHIF